jgi:hypothetical protein
MIIRAGEEYKKFENSSGIIPRSRKIDRTNEALSPTKLQEDSKRKPSKSRLDV